jgi:hypothetical protein
MRAAWGRGEKKDRIYRIDRIIGMLERWVF